MFKFIQRTAVATWIAINFSNIIKLGGCALTILVVGFMHLRWEVYLVEAHPEKLLILLIVNSFIFFVILIWMSILLKRCLTPLFPNKALKAKESIIKKPERFKEILSVKLRPKLREKNN